MYVMKNRKMQNEYVVYVLIENGKICEIKCCFFKSVDYIIIQTYSYCVQRYFVD